MVGEEDVLTVEEVAKRLKIHYQTAYEKVRSGEIPAFKLGRHWRVLRSDLIEYLDNLKKSSR